MSIWILLACSTRLQLPAPEVTCFKRHSLLAGHAHLARTSWYPFRISWGEPWMCIFMGSFISPLRLVLVNKLTSTLPPSIHAFKICAPNTWQSWLQLHLWTIYSLEYCTTQKDFFFFFTTAIKYVISRARQWSLLEVWLFSITRWNKEARTWPGWIQHPKVMLH